MLIVSMMVSASSAHAAELENFTWSAAAPPEEFPKWSNPFNWELGKAPTSNSEVGTLEFGSARI